LQQGREIITWDILAYSPPYVKRPWDRSGQSRKIGPAKGGENAAAPRQSLA